MKTPNDAQNGQKNHQEPVTEQPNNHSPINELESDGKAGLPACDLIWINGSFVVKCDTEEDGKIALDLLRNTRIELGRQKVEPSKESSATTNPES